MLETSFSQPQGFSEMSKAEQVRYLQALWDQIAQQPGELSVPESHLLFGFPTCAALQTGRDTWLSADRGAPAAERQVRFRQTAGPRG